MAFQNTGFQNNAFQIGNIAGGAAGPGDATNGGEVANSGGPIFAKTIFCLALAYCPFTPVAVETVTVDKFYTQLSEPTRLKRSVPDQQELSYGYAPVFDPATVHYQPLSEPYKIKRPVRYQQELAYTATPVFNAATVPYWPLSTPVRLKKTQTAGTYEVLAPVFNAGTVPYSPLSEPVRLKKIQTAGAYETLTPIFNAATVPYWPLSEPVRLKKVQGAGTHETLSPVFNAATVPYAALSEPHKIKRRAAYQQELAFEPTPVAPAFDASTLPYLPLSEPVRLKKVQTAGEYQGYYQVAVAEVVTVDKWYAQLSEPVRRQKRPFGGADNDHLPRPFTIEWFQPLQTPTRLTVRRQTAGEYQGNYPVVVAAETITADKWWQPLSIPVLRTRITFGEWVNYTPDADQPVVEPPSAGGRIVGGHFSRGQWRKLKECREKEWCRAVEAQEQAEAKALAIKNAKAQAKAYRATQLANEAISLAGLNEEIELTALINALETAAGARATADAMARVKRISQEIITRIEEEEDEEDAIMFLLMN